VKLNRIFFIVNLSAGQKEPITEYINNIFYGSDLTWSIYVLQKGEHASEIVRSQIGLYDLIVVYGGDGSVTEAARHLIGTKTPLAIIPGGTANILAKELGIPQDIETALKLIRDQSFMIKTIDTGLVNGRPFLLRINLGIMATMITEANPELKESLGQMAYGISAIKAIYKSEPVTYMLDIDGKTINVEGESLTITNSGSMGIGYLQMQPGISIEDGLLDVVLLKDAGLLSLVKATGSSLFNQETDAISHWACRKVTVTMQTEQLFLCDDCEDKAKQLAIEVVPASLTVVIPIED
jgi:diacylglycerol kinase (ATP)